MRIAKITALLALAAFLGAGTRLAWLAGTAARDLPDRADAAITRELDATRAMVGKQTVAALTSARIELDFTRRVLDARLASVERTAASEVQAQGQAVLGALDARLGQALGDLDAQLRSANASIAQVAAVAPSVQRTTEAFHEQFMSPTITVADGSTRGNPGALYPRWLALSGEAMRTSDSIRRIADAQADVSPAQAKAMTELAQNIAGISADVHVVTSEYVRPRRWYERLWSGLKAVGGVAVLAVK
jgi:hypothetical protein